MRYPNWFMEMGGHTQDTDDWSNGRLDEHRRMRDAQMQVLGRVTCFKPMKGALLQMIVSSIDSINP